MIMNREIKFRAWHTKSRVMLHEGDCYGTNDPLDAVRYFQEGQPVILMQSTGISDRTGLEIYEGDIVTNGVAVFIAEWNFNICGIWWLGYKRDSKMFHQLSRVIEESYEVIGNIYENKNILK